MDIATFTAHRETLAAPGGEIAYTEFGDGPVALFVHGLGTSGALWRHAIEELSGTSRCIAIDLPGHGGTPARADASVAAMADEVAELCDGLGLDRVDLVGNDTGGAVAQIFAARQPGRLRTLTLTNCDSERTLAALDAADLSAVHGALAALTVPTLIVWGTGDAMFGTEWAYQLRDLIPGAREVIEIEGAKVFFPEERPGDLVPHLGQLWKR